MPAAFWESDRSYPLIDLRRFLSFLLSFFFFKAGVSSFLLLLVFKEIPQLLLSPCKVSKQRSFEGRLSGSSLFVTVSPKMDASIGHFI